MQKQGLDFVKLLLSTGHSNPVIPTAHLEKIQKNFGYSSKVNQIAKEIVAAGTTTNPLWAGNLVNYNLMVSEFVNVVMQGSIIGKLVGYSQLPYNTAFPVIATGSTTNWIGEGQPILPTQLTLGNNIRLTAKKVGGIILLSKELIRATDDAAINLIKDDLARSAAENIDASFINPDVTETEDRPAAITNGATEVTTTGNIVNDIDLLISTLTNGSNMFFPYLIMSKKNAAKVSSLKGSDERPIYQDMTVMGGIISGVQVIVSNGVKDDVVVALDASDIAIADNGLIEMSQSDQSVVYYYDEQGEAKPFNIYQSNLIGFRTIKFIDYKRRRDSAVVYMQGVAW